MAERLLRPLSYVAAKLFQQVVPKSDYLRYSVAIFPNVAEYGQRPNWSGFMEFSYRGIDHPSPWQIKMLPSNDLGPNDESCIYATLLLIIEMTHKYDIVAPSTTVDQPLWAKAVEIIQAKDLKIVLRLDSFHSHIIFVESLGMVMEGSGLEKLLETFYAPNSVLPTLSGKAIESALRGHFLANTALKIKLLYPTVPCCQNFKGSIADDIEGCSNINENWFSFRQFTTIF